jgi:hypothetical protein
MNFFGELVRRLSMLFHRGQFDADLKEEMRLHLVLSEQQQLQAGMTQTNARSAARRRFGNPTVLKETSQMRGDGSESMCRRPSSRLLLQTAYRRSSLTQGRTRSFSRALAQAVGTGTEAGAHIFSDQ